MSLEIKNISKKYGNQEALSNISFSLNKGDIVGFLGPNGAGKTTLMRIITSTLKQDSGEVTVFGKSTISEEIETKNVIGYLAEHNPLYKEMNVIEYLQFIASLYKIKDFNIPCHVYGRSSKYNNIKPNFNETHYSLSFSESLGPKNYRLPLWVLFINWFEVNNNVNNRHNIKNSSVYN